MKQLAPGSVSTGHHLHRLLWCHPRAPRAWHGLGTDHKQKPKKARPAVTFNPFLTTSQNSQAGLSIQLSPLVGPLLKPSRRTEETQPPAVSILAIKCHPSCTRPGGTTCVSKGQGQMRVQIAPATSTHTQPKYIHLPLCSALPSKKPTAQPKVPSF